MKRQIDSTALIFPVILVIVALCAFGFLAIENKVTFRTDSGVAPTPVVIYLVDKTQIFPGFVLREDWTEEQEILSEILNDIRTYDRNGLLEYGVFDSLETHMLERVSFEEQISSRKFGLVDGQFIFFVDPDKTDTLLEKVCESYPTFSRCH